jgi:hypothetical protein
MSVQTVYDQYAVSDAQRERIETATYRTLITLYGLALTRAMESVGKHRRVVVTDTATLLVLRRKARETAQLMQRGMNTRIRARLDAAPAESTDREMAAFLGPTLDAMRQYNVTVLPEYAYRWADARAARDLYQRNGITAVWTLASEVDACDTCAAIADGNPYTTDDASTYETPMHPQCRCEWTVADADIPHDFAWYGQDMEAA